MTPEALEGFRRVRGWKVGVDGSVALITVGIGGSIDSSKVASPIRSAPEKNACPLATW